MDDNTMRGMPQLNCLLEKHKQMEARSAFKSHHEPQNTQNIAMDYHTTENSHYYPNNYEYYQNSYGYYPSNYECYPNNYGYYPSNYECYPSNYECYPSNYEYYPNNYECYPNNYEYQERLPPPTVGKVYVNPNYGRRKPVIHINPKLIQNFTNAQNHEQIAVNVAQQNQPPMPTNIQSRSSVVHVNPKLMTKLISNVPDENQQKCNIINIPSIQSSSVLPDISVAQIQPSSSPNRSEFSNICIQNNPSTSTPVPRRKKSMTYTVQHKTKFVKNSVQKKNSNSSLVALSRRKLVRLRKSPRSSVAVATSSLKSISPLKRRLSSSGLKKTKVSPKNVILSSTTQLFKVNRLKLVRNIDKADYYNDKFASISSKVSCKKKIDSTRKVLSNSVRLVSINGIMYKKSRNQLIRSNPSPLKKRRNSTLNKSNQYFIAKNGKKLLKLDKSNFKLDKSKKKMNSSSLKLNTSVCSAKNYKANASNKVKQRSLQILRNKMRKNNQPCLLFQKFGYCANQLKGTCSKVHDKKQVQLCKNFLQGKCLLENCQLSHDVGPEKMPTCKYFLEGCCSRDGCPYLHVKVSSKNPICVEFLRGYCSQGNECQKRHTFACPEFDKSGKCSKGKFCPYPHKSHLTETKRFRKVARRKNNVVSTKEPVKLPTELKPVEIRKRYYDETSEDLSQKREKLLKTVKIMKNVHEVQPNSPSKEKDSNVSDSETTNDKDSADCEEKREALCNRPKRPPIGPLPAYIPFD